jgi:hypothetical protein
MTYEEALKKATEGWELGIIPFEKIDEYAAYLLRQHINKDIDKEK